MYYIALRVHNNVCELDYIVEGKYSVLPVSSNLVYHIGCVFQEYPSFELGHQIRKETGQIVAKKTEHAVKKFEITADIRHGNSGGVVNPNGIGHTKDEFLI